MYLRTKSAWVGLCGGAILLGSISLATASAAGGPPAFPTLPVEQPADSGNPYTVIIDRNVFRLNTPPPAHDPAQDAPPPDLPKVVFNGFEKIGDDWKALLAVHSKNSTGDKSQPSESADYYVMSSGEKDGPVELVRMHTVVGDESIDIINSGTAMTLTLKKDGYVPTAAPPPAAGVGPRNRVIPGAGAPPPQPNIPGFSGDNPGGGALIGGLQPRQAPTINLGRAPGSPEPEQVQQYGFNSGSSGLIKGGAVTPAPVSAVPPGGAPGSLSLIGPAAVGMPKNSTPPPTTQLPASELPPVPPGIGEQ
jgi:hypothetical protein